MTNSTTKQELVWDVPVRVFHWLLALSFAGAWITAESERWRPVHITFGYTMAGLVSLRIIWGFIGTRYARFASFVRGPAATLSYLKSLASARPEHHAGHNPAGAVAIVGMLALIALTTASGWANYEGIGWGWFEEAHEIAAELLMALVVVHLAGVALSSFLHRENLVRSMVTGFKKTPTSVNDPRNDVRSWSILGAALLGIVLTFWWWQWQDGTFAGSSAGSKDASAPASAEVRNRHHERREDD